MTAPPQDDANTAKREKHFPCKQCGAKLVFMPGLVAMQCEHCGFSNPVPKSKERIQELDFHAYLSKVVDNAETHETSAVSCESCGAVMQRPEHTTAFVCPFCGCDIVATAAARTSIKPRSLLPFRITRQVARESFRKWVTSRWFAPSKLKKYARMDTRLTGMYVPYWTYDTDATSSYTGERGDDYWETETYTTTENGKTVTKTRRVRKTRWTWVSGVVFNRFDDVLVVASRSLPTKYVRKLEPWDLDELVGYNDDYLSGFVAESYQINLEEGFDVAKELMDGTIRASIRSDIGGDHQRIDSVDTQYDDITFKHILLPVWLSAYRFKERVFRFLVNGRTGEVQGERPWSWIKITLFVLFILAVIGGIVVAGEHLR